MKYKMRFKFNSLKDLEDFYKELKKSGIKAIQKWSKTNCKQIKKGREKFSESFARRGPLDQLFTIDLLDVDIEEDNLQNIKGALIGGEGNVNITKVSSNNMIFYTSTEGIKGLGAKKLSDTPLDFVKRNKESLAIHYSDLDKKLRAEHKDKNINPVRVKKIASLQKELSEIKKLKESLSLLQSRINEEIKYPENQIKKDPSNPSKIRLGKLKKYVKSSRYKKDIKSAQRKIDRTTKGLIKNLQKYRKKYLKLKMFPRKLKSIEHSIHTEMSYIKPITDIEKKMRDAEMIMGEKIKAPKSKRRMLFRF